MEEVVAAVEEMVASSSGPEKVEDKRQRGEAATTIVVVAVALTIIMLESLHLHLHQIQHQMHKLRVQMVQSQI